MHLDIPQTQTTSFEEALKNATDTTLIATNSILSLINRMELNTWHPIPKLFNNLVSSTCCVGPSLLRRN